MSLNPNTINLPSTDSRRAVVSFWRKNVDKHWLTALRTKYAQEKVCLGKLTALDRTLMGWLGQKTSTQTMILQHLMWVYTVWSSLSVPILSVFTIICYRTKKLYTEDDEVLLISPVSQGEGDSGEEGRGLITRATRHSTRQAELKKDGTKVLVRTLMKRPVRTKHRFGPVGTKKKTAK